MQKHTKAYNKFFGYTPDEWKPCEVCNRTAAWVHHIDCKGMGGDPQGKKEHIENYMAICVDCEKKYADRAEYMDYLYWEHKKFIQRLRPDYTFLNYDKKDKVF